MEPGTPCRVDVQNTKNFSPVCSAGPFFRKMAQFMEVGPTHRELAAFDLAERLFFKLEKKGDGYSLCREVGEFAPANDLSLEEVEQLLERWKLQGPHGG
jgi:hypothetical protein